MIAATRAWLATPLGRAVAALAVVRMLIPVVALAGSGHDLPLLPPYAYAPLNGDAQGFYSAMRAVIAAAPHVHPALILLEALLLVVAGTILARTWRLPGRRWVGVLVLSVAVSIGASLVVSAIERSTGAAVVGWSLVWALLLFPFRLLGAAWPGDDLAFAVGFGLSLLCVAATTVATAVLALRLTHRRAVAVAAAAAWALWPLYVAPLAGRSAWENGQWNVDVGLHLYTEPFSTALVACALALVAGRTCGDGAAVAAGLLLGYSTVAKLSNGLVAAVVVALLLLRRAPRPAVLVAVGTAVWMPLLGAYWPKGYVGMFGGRIAAEEDPFALAHAGHGWGDSLLFTPRFLAVALPLLVLGLLLATRWARALLGVPIAVTAAFYTFYTPFAVHPRFLYVVLPPALVLAGIAIVFLADRGAALLGRRVDGRAHDAVSSAP